MFFLVFVFQAEAGIRDAHYGLEFRRVLFRSAVSIGASICLFLVLPKDFLPPEDTGFIQGYTLARDGTSPFLMNEYQMKLGEEIRKDPKIGRASCRERVCQYG